ncbi:MAG: HNH endonuclease [Aphanizomenon gracile PMC649.10]|nr:HNH endonuclease [Aphanizomenon gracile PMC649.10]
MSKIIYGLKIITLIIAIFQRGYILFFPKDYFNQDDKSELNFIESIVEASRFISNDYITNQPNEEINLWKDFFTTLGVQETSPTKVIEYILEIFTKNNQWMNTKHETHLKYIQYIFDNYKYIRDNQLSERLRQSIFIKNSSPIISDLPNQSCYSKPSEVYFVSNSHKQNNNNDIEFLSELVAQNNYISNDYFRSSLEANDWDEVNEWEKFFKRLGVKEITPYEIIKNFILPLYTDGDKSKNYLSKSNNINFRCVLYIKDNFKYLTNDKGLLQNIKSHLRIECKNLCDHSTSYWTAQNLYIGQRYNNEIDLESLFKDIEDAEFVSSLYLEKYLENISISHHQISTHFVEEWKEFFVKVGVNTIPKVNIISKIISLNEYERNKLLLKLLDNNWDHYREQRQQNSYSPIEASWFTQIKNDTWIPTTNNKRLEKSSEVFINKDNIKKILGNSVFYVSIELTNKNFIKDIPINTSPTVSAILEKLRELSQINDTNQELLIELYQLLEEKFAQQHNNQIQSAFKNSSLIYIPDTSQRYFKLDQVFWKDHSKQFGKKLRGYLENEYPQLYNFFVCKLQVTVDPKPHDYAKVLLDLSKNNKLTNEDIKIIWRVYRELNEHLEIMETKKYLLSQEYWWNDFIQQSIIYTHNNNFSLNHEILFVNDDEELFDLFQDQEGIEFLQLPAGNCHHQIDYFLKEMNIKYISHCVQIELSIDKTETLRESTDITQQIQGFIPYILRYLYHQDNKKFKALKRNNILLSFQNIRAYIVNKLTVKYTLEKESVLAEKQMFLDKEKNTLYIHSNYLKDTDNLAIELAKFFSDIQGVEDFMISLFDKKTDQKIRKYLEAKKIADLPNDEKKYFGLLENISHDEDILEDETEEKIETNKLTVETSHSINNLSSDDLITSPQQCDTTSENTVDNKDFESNQTQASSQTVKHPENSTSKPISKQNTKNSQSQDSQTKSNSQVNYSITNDEEIDHDSDFNLEKNANKKKSQSNYAITNDEEINNYMDDTNDEIDDYTNLNLDSYMDKRERVTTEIVQRPEQAEFRRRLLNLYAGKCVITDYDVTTALIAAHIIPYKTSQDDKPSNGLLLRADIHLLFDHHLIGIDPMTMTVRISPRLVNTKYAELEGKKLNIQKVNKTSIQWHYDRCRWG